MPFDVNVLLFAVAVLGFSALVMGLAPAWRLARVDVRALLKLVGLAGAYAGGRLVASRVYAMRAADPVVLLAAGLMVAAVALVAAMIPALRASRIDAVRALRAE